MPKTPPGESDHDLEFFCARLEERRTALLEIAAHSDAAAQPVELDQQRVGRLSRMDAMQAQAMAQASAARRQLELKRIEASLGRIDAGDYGYCLRCDEPIATGRLKVDLTATLCIGCAEAAAGS